MCTAKATLVYGLTIQSSSLVFAANAWTRLSQTFNFLDLILLRRRTGNLISSNKEGRGAVTKVPEEVWEEIKKYNVLDELAVSEDHFLRPLICNDSRCRFKPAPGAGVTWEKLVDIDEEECAYTWNLFEEFALANIATWTERTISDVQELLSSFGLALPTHQPILTEDDWADRAALALISAPTILRSGDSAVPLVEASCGQGAGGPDGHSIAGVSFNLPPDIDRRFKEFISLFQLQVIDLEINQIVPRLTKDKIQRLSKDPRSEGVSTRVAKSIKPGWKLYVMCETS
ncbi:hypothetical protein JCM5350_006820 [Sporobolomyces pararoseus]